MEAQGGTRGFPAYREAYGSRGLLGAAGQDLWVKAAAGVLWLSQRLLEGQGYVAGKANRMAQVRRAVLGS